MWGWKTVLKYQLLIFRIKYWYNWGFWFSKVNELGKSTNLSVLYCVTLACVSGTGVGWLSTQKDLEQENENSPRKVYQEKHF